MKVHRFYIGGRHPKEVQRFGEPEAWVQDESLRHQMGKVLRLKVGETIGLFNGDVEFLYRITNYADKEIALEKVAEVKPKLPKKHIYLFFSLLKKDNSEWVLQKCTELGVRNFVPLVADRSEKIGFDMERAEKIVIEAAEQCGRSDIPHIREPLTVAAAISEYEGKVPLLFCDETGSEATWTNLDTAGILIGPEGGWSDAEKELFNSSHVAPLVLNDFTLRAETAAVAAVNKLLV